MKNLFQRLAIETRGLVTSPWRRHCLRKRSAVGAAPMNVLFYHRVASDWPNGWTIDPGSFARHIAYCRRHFELVGLDDVQRMIARGRCDGPTVTFTFDDGYADNVEHAIPQLLQHAVPTVYFVATFHVRTGRPFAHDLQARCPLPVNSIAQVRAMSDAGITIGSHTRHHVDFSETTDPAIVRDEIIGGKHELEDMIGRRVDHFAVPYGMPKHMTSIVIRTAREAGLRSISSAFGGYNIAGRDGFHIRRFHGDPEFGRLKNWLSFDPRKLEGEPMLETMIDTMPAAAPAAVRDDGTDRPVDPDGQRAAPIVIPFPAGSSAALTADLP